LRSAWGDFSPTLVHLTEWPDAKAVQHFATDKRAAELRGLLDSALSKLTVTHCREQVGGH
jgi:hypothetical protein